MNFQPAQPSQNEMNSGKNEGNGIEELSFPSKPLMSVNAAGPVSVPGTSNGRLLPVVYVKMPQREMLPSVSRSGTIISTLSPKISTAPSVSSPPMLISTASNSNSSSSGSQSGFVTLQGSLRSVSQSVAPTSTLAPSQPHIITLPKGSNTALLANQQLITLQSTPSTGQVGVGPGQQQQYVTIQGTKSQGSSATLNPGQVQPHYVTIRTPVLAPSGVKGATSGNQPQFLTIQAPVLQPGSSANPTFLPVSAVGATPTGSKPTVTYQVLKSNPKTRDQHLVYPLPVANLLPSSQPKMVLTPVSIMPKLSVQSGASVSVTSSADVVTSVTNISAGKAISSAAVVKTNNLALSSPKVIANVRLQPKPLPSQSLLKEPVQLFSNADVLLPSAQKLIVNNTSLPSAVTVGTTAGSNISTQGQKLIVTTTPIPSAVLVETSAASNISTQGQKLIVTSTAISNAVPVGTAASTNISTHGPKLVMSSSSLPTAVTVGATGVTNVATQGFINITIANGHIQPNALKEVTNVVPASGTSSAINDVPPGEEKLDQSFSKTVTETSVTSKAASSTVTEHVPPDTEETSADKPNNTPDDKEPGNLEDEISINSLLKSNNVHYKDSINQKAVTENTQSDKLGVENSADKLDLLKCLESGSKDSDSSKSNDIETTQPMSPMNLFCDDDISLVKLSPTDEPPVAKFTVKINDDPNDEIKIELVRDDDTSALNSKENRDVILPHTEDHTPHYVSRKPLLLKKSSKYLSGLKGSGGSKSLIRNPASMQSILVKNSKPSKLKFKCSSILKPKASKQSSIKVEESDIDRKDSFDFSKLPADTDIKIENLDSPRTPTALGDFDAIDALEWKNGIGALPGSNLRFRMNEFGLVEIVSDDDEKSEKDKKEVEKDPNSPTSESLQIDDGSNSSMENKSNKDKKGLDDIFCCEVCRVYGLASEFLNSRFCTQACSALYTVKQAWQYKREQDLRALRLRRKKRRLEQRLARDKDQDSKDEDAKPDMKRMKLEMPDDVSDYENSVDEPRIVDQSASQINVNAANQDDECSLTGLADGNESVKKGKTQKTSGNFTWTKYLEMVQARAAGVELFKEPSNKFQRNGFRVGMKLEGIDPHNPSVFCVLSVAETRGYRIRLHFDGYPDNYDFWVNADSPEIFPARWCEKNNRRLSAPKGQPTPFNWTSYLKQSKSIAAPKYSFLKSTGSSTQPFKVNMKIEAVDRKNSSLICVASVADVLDNRILIHFDSWDNMYDYWIEPSSPYIHPVGWCEKNGFTLTPPNQYKDPSHFSWERYLKETKAVAAPARNFKPRSPRAFRPGMRVEAVDKRVPHLVRVATIDDVEKYRIRIRFDGWPDDYSYWVDDDSPDIHYPGWCIETKHPLEPPLSEEDMRVLAKCGIPGCKGEGHIKGPKFSTHNSAQNCPYAPENIRKDCFLPDRLSGLFDPNYSDESSPKERSLHGRISGKKEWTRLLQDDHKTSGRLRLSDDDDEVSPKPSLISSMQQKLQNELERSVIDPGYHIETGAGLSACWAKHSQPLQSSLVNNASNPSSWNVQDVVDFLSSISCLSVYGKLFKEQDIDGEALLLLTQNELVSNLSLKLGHAITLYNCIVLLRQKCV